MKNLIEKMDSRLLFAGFLALEILAASLFYITMVVVVGVLS